MSNINVNNITPVTGTKVSVSGSLHASGDITANGNITLGDATTDSITFSAEISSSIIPDANNVYDLGSNSKVWSTVHANYISGSLTGTATGLSGTPNITVGILVQVQNNGKIYTLMEQHISIRYLE